ncbi:ParB/RepB/Spo0J family partition protein [Nakamurella antarctica]|uniref:ParB/RepB/Spo0J family partition protein n=1 Tax=Nakamurella antarctica TaxID=1902245 RepID=A0A3G8ZPT8_9ACTN|nr:ParB/RepB/Spo0J family partition protein [Nakamurella antarctica]AZI59280.1 ParB/RepB/Spo0J family partition protein [Nakamurella antarctica]
MSKSRGGLGRGLASLIPSGPASPINDVIIGGTSRATEQPAAVPDKQPEEPHEVRNEARADAPQGPHYREIPVGSIRPNPVNPRTIFDEEALAELEHSIREFGLLQPIVVREAEDGYELIMGERRWRAAGRAGLEVIPAIVRRTEDADLLRDALLENIHRANLNPLEEAAAYQQLLEEFNVTHEELATKLGRSRPVISNTIRLLKLPVPVQRRVAAGILSAGHARALLSLEEAEAQEELAIRIVAEGLSVRGTEEAVTMMAGRKAPPKRPAPKKLIMPALKELASNLSDTFDTRVLVELGRKKGRIVVEFATVDDLERIVSIMAPKSARRSAKPKTTE